MKHFSQNDAAENSESLQQVKVKEINSANAYSAEIESKQATTTSPQAKDTPTKTVSRNGEQDDSVEELLLQLYF